MIPRHTGEYLFDGYVFWVPVIPSLSVSVGLDVYRDCDVSGTLNSQRIHETGIFTY